MTDAQLSDEDAQLPNVDDHVRAWKAIGDGCCQSITGRVVRIIEAELTPPDVDEPAVIVSTERARDRSV